MQRLVVLFLLVSPLVNPLWTDLKTGKLITSYEVLGELHVIRGNRRNMECAFRSNQSLVSDSKGEVKDDTRVTETPRGRLVFRGSVQ